MVGSLTVIWQSFIALWVHTFYLIEEGLMYVKDSWKYSFCQSFRQKCFLTKVWWSLYNTRDITSFQTLQRIRSIPTLSRVLFYRHIDESRDRFENLMQSEPRGKVGSVFDITRITLLYRHHIRSYEMQKSQLSMWPKWSYIRLFVWLLTGAES